MTPIIGDLIESSLGKLVQGGIDIIKRLIPDKGEQAKAEMELRVLAIAIEKESRQMEHEERQGQLEINKIEAASNDAFVRRSRPAAMWVCVAAMAYNFIGYPIGAWACAIWYPSVKPPMLPDPEYLMILMGALLGLGGFRSWEKVKGVAGT